MYPYGYSNDFFVSPDFGSDIAGVGMTVVGGIIAVVLFFYLIFLAFGVVSYIFRSLGTYSVAKRRGIDHPWLTWIPVGNAWILGCISDQYQYVAKGKVKNRRKVLLGLVIATTALSFPVGIVGGLMSALAFADATAAIFAVLTVLLSLGIVAVSIVYAVFHYMALYDLYRSCEPSDAVLFLVLSILFSVAEPFIIFACRKKDRGMPERKPAPVVQLVEEPEENVIVDETAAEETAVEEMPAEEIPAEEIPAEENAEDAPVEQ